MKIAIWGFYDQGNLGDDLMAMMIFELIESLHHVPTIITRNPRFEAMGYRTVSEFNGEDYDFLILGGGAFFKKQSDSKAAIENNLRRLSEEILRTGVKVLGVSLGSDGVSSLDEISDPRKSIVKSDNFKGCSLRLEADLSLGVKNCMHLPDLVLMTRICSEQFPRLRPTPFNIKNGSVLLNLSKRHFLTLPRVLIRNLLKPIRFFYAHTSMGNTGGEISLPIFPKIRTTSVNEQLYALKTCDRIISTKLHPGVIAISFGRQFQAISPRPKTTAFLESFVPSTFNAQELFQSYTTFLKNALE